MIAFMRRGSDSAPGASAGGIRNFRTVISAGRPRYFRM
jgi:hypothetical protein